MDMTEFDRKVEEASARFNRSVANIAETLEKETAELVTYLNDEVVPAVRTHSSNALRTAPAHLSQFADLLATQHKSASAALFRAMPRELVFCFFSSWAAYV